MYIFYIYCIYLYIPSMFSMWDRYYRKMTKNILSKFPGHLRQKCRKIWDVYHYWFHFNFSEGCCFLDPSDLGIPLISLFPILYLSPHQTFAFVFFLFADRCSILGVRTLRFSFGHCGNFSLSKKTEFYTWKAMKEQIIF